MRQWKTRFRWAGCSWATAPWIRRRPSGARTAPGPRPAASSCRRAQQRCLAPGVPWAQLPAKRGGGYDINMFASAHSWSQGALDQGFAEIIFTWTPDGLLMICPDPSGHGNNNQKQAGNPFPLLMKFRMIYDVLKPRGAH